MPNGPFDHDHNLRCISYFGDRNAPKLSLHSYLGIVNVVQLHPNSMSGNPGYALASQSAAAVQRGQVGTGGCLMVQASQVCTDAGLDGCACVCARARRRSVPMQGRARALRRERHELEAGIAREGERGRERERGGGKRESERVGGWHRRITAEAAEAGPGGQR